MLNIQQKRIDRFRFLHLMYEGTHGHPHKYCVMWDIGEKLGFDREYTDDIVSFLEGEYLVEYKASGGMIVMTHHGRIEIEEALEKPDEETEHFPSFSFINVESMNQSQIIQSSSGVGDISFNIENANLPTLKSAFESLLKRIDELKVSEEVTQQLVADAKSALGQLNSPKPNLKALGYLKKNVVDLLRSIATSVVAAELLKLFG